MAISQNFYDLERKAISEFGDDWHKVLSDEHPLVVAIRNSVGIDDQIIKDRKRRKGSPVKAFENGKYIGIYPTITECGKALKISGAAISEQLNKRTKLVKKKYTFEYVEENEE